MHLGKADQPRAHAVVNVVGVVGDFIGQIAQLRLQAGLLAQQKARAHTALAVGVSGLVAFERGGVVARAVFQNTLARLEAQVQAVKVGVTLF